MAPVLTFVGIYAIIIIYETTKGEKNEVVPGSAL